MATLVLQAVIVPVLRMCFAAIALLIVRKAPTGQTKVEQAAWYVTGVVFATQAIMSVVQGFFAIIAYFAGPGSPWLNGYLRLAPAANHSRGLLTYCLFLTLLVLLLKGERATRGRWNHAFLAVVAGSALAGAGVGLLEGALVPGRHYMNIALSETFVFLVIATTLFAALFRHLLDRWLWGALAIYGISGVFNSIYVASLAWAHVPESWSPPAWHLQAFRGFFAAAIVIIAAWRLHLANRGIVASGFLEEKRPSAVFHQL